jgi:hypothetical protein
MVSWVTASDSAWSQEGATREEMGDMVKADDKSSAVAAVTMKGYLNPQKKPKMGNSVN